MTRAACHASPRRRDDRSAVNRLIDSGAGVFGDETVLVDDKKAGLDGNADALNAWYASVCVRRGLNRDGVNQAEEPQGSAASGVQSTEPAHTAGDQLLSTNAPPTREDFMRLSSLNPGKQGHVSLATKRFLAVALGSLLCLSACSDREKLPEPPLSFPYDAQKAGFKIETDMRVVDYNSYRFGFKLGFKEGDATDRERVKKLAGDHGRDKAGKLIRPGVPIAVRVRINARKPSELEGVFEKTFLEEEQIGFSVEHFYTEITNVELKPGTYHLIIENLQNVPELQHTSVTLFIASHPKSTSIPD